MAKQKTINDVVHELQEIGKSIDSLLQVERREARVGGAGAGGAGGRSAMTSMMDDIKRYLGMSTGAGGGGGSFLQKLWNTGAVKIARMTTRFATVLLGPVARMGIQLDSLIFHSASSGRDLGKVIENLKDEKFGFLGGLQNNALMQVAALRSGFDLQDVRLREQLTILDKDAVQGQLLLTYANSLVKQGMTRDQGDKFLKELANTTQTSIQSGDTMIKILAQLSGGAQAVLSQFGLGLGAQAAVKAVTKDMDAAMGVDVAMQVRDLLFVPEEKMAEYANTGGRETTARLAPIIAAIEKQGGKVTPSQRDELLDLLRDNAQAGKEFYRTFTGLIPSEGGNWDALVAGAIQRSDVLGGGEQLSRMEGILAGINMAAEVDIKRRGDSSLWKTPEEHLRALSTSLEQVGNIWNELLLREISTRAGDWGRDLFGPLFESVEGVERARLEGRPLNLPSADTWTGIWDYIQFFMGNWSSDADEISENTEDISASMQEVVRILRSLDIREAARAGIPLPDSPNSGDTPQLA